MSPTATLAELQVSSPGFAGGVNIRDNIAAVGPGECRRIENCILDEVGALRARMGMAPWSSAPMLSGSHLLSSHVFYRGGSLTPIVLTQTTGGVLWQLPVTTAGAYAGGGTQLATGLSGTVPLSFETYNGKCYMSNSVDGYMSYNGTAYVTYPTTPKFSFILVWKDAMWGAFGNDRLYESAAGDPETWPVAGWVDITKGNGDFLTGLGSDGTYLLWFKQRQYGSVYDAVTFANKIIDFEKGCESHFSIRPFEGEVYFISRRGICRYQGADTPGFLVSGVLDPLFDPQVLNFSKMNLSSGYLIGNRVGWCLPEAGNNFPNIQIEYYPRLGKLNTYGIRALGPFAFHRMPVNHMGGLRVGGSMLLLGAGGDGVLYSTFVIDPVEGLTDYGASGVKVPYTAIVETGAINFGQAMNDKYLRHLRVLGSGRISLMVRNNFGTSVIKTFIADLTSSSKVWNTGNWNEGTWGPDELYKLPVIDIDLYGKFFTLEFHSTIQPGAAGVVNSNDIGRRQVPVGSSIRTLNDAAFALYSFFLEAKSVGVR